MVNNSDIDRITIPIDRGFKAIRRNEVNMSEDISRIVINTYTYEDCTHSLSIKNLRALYTYV